MRAACRKLPVAALLLLALRLSPARAQGVAMGGMAASGSGGVVGVGLSAIGSARLLAGRLVRGPVRLLVLFAAVHDGLAGAALAEVARMSFCGAAAGQRAGAQLARGGGVTPRVYQI